MAEHVVKSFRLTVIIGASFTSTITWKDAAGVLVPLPVGTGAEVKVRPALGEDEVLIRFSTAPGATDGLIVLTDPGVTTLSLTAAQTAKLSPIADAVFDIKYTFASGQRIIKLEHGKGLVDIREASTR